MKKSLTLILILLIGSLSIFAQETEKPEKPRPVPQERVKAWQLPSHMMEALQALINQKIEEYKKFLIANVKGFEDMPENVVFDMSTGIFITPEGIAKIQSQQKREVKKDEK